MVHGQRGWNGVAILARKPIEVVQQRPARRGLGARFVTRARRGASVTTVYSPNGKYVGHEDFPRKLAWHDALAEHSAASHPPDEPAVLCGDFNLCPQRDRQLERSAAPRRHLPHRRGALALPRLLDGGLVDVFRERHPDTQAFSWWDYRAGDFHKREGLRIDFLLATRPVLARARAADIDREYRKKKDGLIASDHAPVFADLN